MWKFMRGKGYQPNAERAKLQKELFQFNKTIHHGFPSKPTALAWDPKLHLMAIGARNGVTKVYGAPGVEFYGQHENVECSVLQIFFLPNQGRLITLCDDNTLHLWEINFKNEKSVMDEVKSCSLEGRLKIISTCCLQSNAEHLLIGTEGGNIYLLDVKSFEMTDHIIYQDVVMQNVPDDYKVNPGAVEAIAEHPTDPNKILIGYNRGLLVLWDNNSLNADQTYVGSQQLQSVSWHRKGSEFMSAHNDGSYIIWSIKDSTKPHQPATTPYGPFPCKAIKKIDWKSAKRGEFIIFNGGMPRASYGDRNTVTVICGDKHVVFELTSRVIDYFTISDNEDADDYDNPHTLIILAEEEMIAIDLESEDWPTFKAPYLSSLHSSAITCAQHCSNIPEGFVEKLILCNQQNKEAYSPRDWPINGGVVLNPMPTPCRDILLTGHEDGTVRFWNASGIALYPLYKLSTSQILSGEDAVEQNVIEEEEWPPFRKVGTFDPYSDDPRLAIKKIALCLFSCTMVVAGTAGQVLVMNLNTVEVEKEIEIKTVNIVGDRDNFVWKGHDQLTVKNGSLKFAPGFQTEVLFQLLPPAACTALALHTEWGLLAAGTAHGFALLDYIQKKPVIFKCTLNPNDLSGYGETTMSRRKSFKKSLRESFRRLRKGKSQRQNKEKRASQAPPSPKTVIEEKKESEEFEKREISGLNNCISASNNCCSDKPRSRLCLFRLKLNCWKEDSAHICCCFWLISLSNLLKRFLPLSSSHSSATLTKCDDLSLLHPPEVDDFVVELVGTRNLHKSHKIPLAVSETDENDESFNTDMSSSEGELDISAYTASERFLTLENEGKALQLNVSLPFFDRSSQSLELRTSFADINSPPIATSTPKWRHTYYENNIYSRDNTLHRLMTEGIGLNESDDKKIFMSGSLSHCSKEATITDADAATPTDSSPIPAPASPSDKKPVERSIEARSVDDTLGSMVRCLYLAQSFLVSVATTTPTLWAGTNNGAIFVFAISLPSKEKREEILVQCQLGKEIQLKHRAPVIAICIVDASNCPIPEPFELQHKLAKDPDNVGNHRVVICSEEQFKVFTLPSLKPYCKFKLTAHEGSCVRKIAFANFQHRSDINYSENCFMCLTNQGDVSVYSIPDLRRQITSLCLKREDITGISSLVFTRNGEGFYLHSSSELQRFSLSAATITEARCKLELPQGMRPAKQAEQKQLNLVDVHSDIPPTDGVTDDAKEEVQQQIEAEKKDETTGDITIDSIKDHLVNSTEETRIIVTEEKTETKQISETIIQTTTIIPVIENVAVPVEASCSNIHNSAAFSNETKEGSS